MMPGTKVAPNGSHGSVMNKSFWNKKRVLVTGHTGFKGIWLCYLLKNLGAEVCGLGQPVIDPKLKIDVKKIAVNEKYGLPIFNDVTQYASVRLVYEKFDPEIVLHLAAQALVLEGIKASYQTYQTNIIGTLNILDCSNYSRSLRAVVSVTTDKVYQNFGSEQRFVETDALNGDSPYGASKACADIISTQHASVLNLRHVGLGVARAGNVVGGGDWAENRLLPDLMRACYDGQKLAVRYPEAVRPWQYVLDLLAGYLKLAQYIYLDPLQYSGAYNFSNMKDDIIKVKDIIKLVQDHSGRSFDVEYSSPTSEEAVFLQLDSTKAKNVLGYNPCTSGKNAVLKALNWYDAYFSGQDVESLYRDQIVEYVSQI